MKRVIKDFSKLTDEMLELLDAAFPEGIRRDDIISFPTGVGKRFHGVEMKEGDILYLIRIPVNLHANKPRFMVMDGLPRKVGEDANDSQVRTAAKEEED